MHHRARRPSPSIRSVRGKRSGRAGTWLRMHLQLLGCLVCLALTTAAAEGEGDLIPKAEIRRLRQELDAAVRETSTVEVRRACKRVVRDARALLEKTPAAANRYAVLDIVFQGQKQILRLEATERNRAAVFDTCRALMKAPDEFAEPRLEAELILTERELAAEEAPVARRVEVLRDILAKYRGTPAEWQSLMIGALVASRLTAFDLEEEIRQTMAERFADDPRAILFRRDQKAAGLIEAVFSGRYKTTDGRTLVFPDDRLGQNYVVHFWSQETPDLDEQFAAIEALRESAPGPLEIYSLNLDQLPDAGATLVRERKLDWTALHLPQGAQSLTCRAYAQGADDAFLVTGLGHVLLLSTPQDSERKPTLATKLLEGVSAGWSLPSTKRRLESRRRLAQLRYLLSGEFLVMTEACQAPPGSPLEDELTAIRARFHAPPLRYRLTPEEEQANCRDIEKRCRKLIATRTDATGLYAIRNCRIISLLGLWNLTCEPEHLADAVEEATTVLASNPPPGTDLVARFCLAREALRKPDTNAETELRRVTSAPVGNEPAPPAFAAGAILALSANARSLHEVYRQALLKTPADKTQMLWPVTSFLRDRIQQYRNFTASPGGYGYGREQKYLTRFMLMGMDPPPLPPQRVEMRLTTLEGAPVHLPAAASREMRGVVLVEPVAEEDARKALMQQAHSFAQVFIRNGVKAVIVFLTGEAEAARPLQALLPEETQATTALMPDGLENPLVQRLGILSADRHPNPLLLAPDGTVILFLSGVRYASFRDDWTHGVGLAIEGNARKMRADVAFGALERGEFEKAVSLFTEALPPAAKKDWWTAARLHGRALAHMALAQWQQALTDVDAATEQRIKDFASRPCVCHGMVELLLTKAMILDHLGRGREAAAQREASTRHTVPHPLLAPGVARQGVPVGVYYERLKQVRLALVKTIE